MSARARISLYFFFLARVDKTSDVADCMLAEEVGGDSIAELGGRAEDVDRSLLCAVGGAERLVCGDMNETLRLVGVAREHRVCKYRAKFVAIAFGAACEERF